ncbi:MAG: Clp protease N-terminal domain-containing protein [Gemmatimonadota bacterium]
MTEPHLPVRPLPARPNLEHERKEAKAFLRSLRASDAAAIARVRAMHPDFDAAHPESARLADAQLTVAREYGFSSWPRLVRYYGEVELARDAYWSLHSMEVYEGSVSTLLAGHRQRQGFAARSFAAYVPRFYGKRVDEVLATSVTTDEARLAVARHERCPSWEVLQERAAASMAARGDGWTPTPLQRVNDALKAPDLAALQAVVAQHPELLTPTLHEMSRGGTLLGTAVHWERVHGTQTMRPIMTWLAEQGQDVQRQLNVRLCGHLRMSTEEVRSLLERGADPNWVAPNGIPVLEHALLRYWNGEAADLVAARTEPRRALWIAAGLGDVQGVSAFLDAVGKPLPSVRQHRPMWNAVGALGVPTVPEPSDEDLLMEAFFVATLNARTQVLEYLISRGVDANSLAYSTPIISMAIGNAWTPVVECLVKCGADLDLRGWHPAQTPRELARAMFVGQRFDETYRRIAELCGLDTEAIVAEENAKPVPEPTGHKTLQVALELAMDDAFRHGKTDVSPENVIFGLLRAGNSPVDLIVRRSGIDAERFRQDVEHRVRPGRERLSEAPLPADPGTQAVLDRMIAAAKAKRREEMNAMDLLLALLRDPQGVAVTMLAQYGGNAGALTEILEKGT